MAPRRKVWFSQFKTRVSKAIAQNNNSKAGIKGKDLVRNNSDYCIEVGKVVRNFKLAKYQTPKPQGIDRKLKDWVEEIQDCYDENWDTVSEIESSKVGDMERRGNSSILAFAIHYRLHADFAHANFATQLDEKVFGTTYESEFKRPVFEDDGKTLAATFHTPELPLTYQYNRREFKDAKKALLAQNTDPARLAITTSIYGTGGYGKTTLAQELCSDEEVRASFPGGIYWLQFGITDSNVEEDKRQSYTARSAIDQMLRAAEYSEQYRGIIDQTNDKKAVQSLIESLPYDPILIVADDLWTQSQEHSLADLPTHISLLATTRVRGLTSRFKENIKIKKLSDEAAYVLMVSDLEDRFYKQFSTHQAKRLRAVSDCFHGWPLLLQLANSTFLTMLDDGASIDEIIDEFEEFATLDSVTAWDDQQPDDTAKDKRQKFVGHCIDVGLRALSDDSYRDALFALGVFPDDTDIPFEVVNDYWRGVIEDRDTDNNRKPGQMISTIKANAIRRRLNNLSYFREYKADAKVFRIHDVFLAYFRSKALPKPLPKQHDSLLGSIKQHCSDGWETLPAEHEYGWQHLLTHLEAAGRVSEADDQRCDFYWIQNALAVLGVSKFMQVFARQNLTGDAKKILKVFKEDKARIRDNQKSLAHVLFGRLGHEEQSSSLAHLLEIVKCSADFSPVPINPHLDPLDGKPLIDRLMDVHWYYGASVSQDGKILVTASADTERPLGAVVRTWDPNEGTLISEFPTHHREVITCLDYDDKRNIVVVGCEDLSCSVLDMTNGSTLGKPFEVHEGYVNSISLSPAGDVAATGSSDESVRIWSIKDQSEVGDPLIGHEGQVDCVQFDPTGKMIASGSEDMTIRFWDVSVREQIGPSLKGHTDIIECLKYSACGRMVASGSRDGEIRIWSTTEFIGSVKVIQGHTRPVSCICFDYSAQVVASGSQDRSVRLWNCSSGQKLCVLDMNSEIAWVGITDGFLDVVPRLGRPSRFDISGFLV